MFGIAWGVGSLLLLVGLGEGFRSGNKKQFDTLGENVMFIWSGRAPVMQGSFTALRQYYLTYRDYQDIMRGLPQRGRGGAGYFAKRYPGGERFLPGQRTNDGGASQCSTRSATCRSMKGAGSM